METHSSILVQEIPWAEEPGGLHIILLNKAAAQEHGQGKDA